jgi:RimJ/RimL family protein N-acetyltransferase
LTVRLEPWGRGDAALLRQCVGDPMMMEHLGGPESEEKLAERQSRYEAEGSDQFKIVEEESGVGVGWVGFWEREWQGAQVYEIGWAVVPAFQGRGIARAATGQALEIARRTGGRRFIHAYPSVENAPSNALCARLGFELLGANEFEYKGTAMRCNDWRFDLLADS